MRSPCEMPPFRGGSHTPALLVGAIVATLFLPIVVPAHAADPEQTPLFIAGQGGYHSYRIPSLIVSKKGTLLAFCEGRKNGRGDSGDIDLVLRRSFDGGKTWAKTQVVWDDGDNTCGNPCPVVDARTGTIWLLLTHNIGSDTQTMIVDRTGKGSRTAWVCKSDDDGATWSKPVEITKDVKKADWTWYATGPGVGIQLKSGRLVVPCDNYVAGTKAKEAHVILSDDGGKTWKLGGVVGPHCNECQIVEVADGNLLLNMRSYRGNNRRLVALSKDGGATFSEPVEVKELVEPVCQASIVRGAGGILFSNPASTKREKMTVRLSRDEGKSWPHAKVLHEGPAAYSCLAVLADGTVTCLYERGDKSAYENITLARFPPGWLSDKKLEGRNRSEEPGLVFSVKTWQGDYSSRDIAGGVETTPAEGAIYSVKADGSGLKKLVQLGKVADFPTASPDGQWVYFQSNASGRCQIYRCRADGSEIRNLTDGRLPEKRWHEAFGYALSADGSQMVFTVHDGASGRVCLASTDGAGARLVAPELGYIYMAALSPAKDRVVFSGPARGYRLLLMTLPDKKPVQLTPRHPESFAPQFTPDGKKIVFIRRDGDVYSVDADGANLRRLTQGNNYVEFRLSAKDQHGSTDGPHVSPDGKRIAYIARKDGVPNLCVMNLDGSDQRQVTFRKSPCGRVRWSPDGKHLAFVSFEGKHPQLFVVAAEGGEPRQLTRVEGAVYFVNWMP